MNNDAKLWANEAAKHLFTAARERSPIAALSVPKSSAEVDALNLAYWVQKQLVAQYLADGDRIVGYKVAITTRYKLKQLSLNSPITGKLLASAAVSNGGAIYSNLLIKPRIEPEIAFVIDKPLRGPHCTIVDVSRAVAYVTPSLEILDARYIPGPFQVFAAVADNVSSSRHVLGSQQHPLADLDLPRIGCILQRNGDIVATGAGGQVLGHPLQSVVELVNDLSTRGEMLEAGNIVLAGGLIEAMPVQSGDHVLASFHTLEIYR